MSISSVCPVFHRESPAASLSDVAAAAPSIVWEARRCFLWNNNLFELLVPSTHDLLVLGGVEGRPIGYLNLSGALLETVESKSSKDRDNSYKVLEESERMGDKTPIDFTPSVSTSASTIHSVRHKGLRDTEGTEDSALSIALRYFPTASPTALRRRVVLRRSTRRGTLKLMQQLLTASRVSYGLVCLSRYVHVCFNVMSPSNATPYTHVAFVYQCTVQDLYEYNIVNETKPDLGKFIPRLSHMT